MPRHPVSPKGVLLIVLLDLFKVSKMTNFNYDLFKVSKMTNFNYDLFKVRKMTNFNYDLFKVSKMYFLKLGGFFGVNAYVYIPMVLFLMVKNSSVMPRKLYKRCSPENVHIDIVANI